MISYLFIFSSCESAYDEDELLRDIEKKRHEIDVKEKTFVYAGDTFRLPAKITQIDSSNSSCAPEEINLTYSFNASDKEAIMHSLFELTSNLSDFGNFDLDRVKKFFYFGVTPLKDAIIDVSNDATHWLYVGSNDKIYSIYFYELLEKQYFVITNGPIQIDEDYIMQWYFLCS